MVAKNRCCGCGSCFNACPQKCITMEEDALGFIYPEIYEPKCIQCGLCEKVCPSMNRIRIEERTDEVEVYAGYAKDKDIRVLSSSGGFFSLIANHILDNGGVVYGAALEKDCRSVSHIMITDANDIKKLQGSKYVQSKTFDTFLDVKERLKNNLVLFSGTPCQIDGLKLFLMKEYDNLVTIEVICHGAPSPAVYRKYIDEMSKKLGDPISSVFFRDEVGGDNLIMKIITSGGNVYRKDQYSDPYYRLFLSNNCLRESCYDCQSKGLYKRADITLGDLWGAENVLPDIIDGGGISLCIAHSDKGKKILEVIRKESKGKSVDFNEAIMWNYAFFKSCNRPEKREEITADLSDLNMRQLVRKYTYDSRAVAKTIIHKLNLTRFVKRIVRTIGW